ncbi:MAG: MBL fold metallo-hydrolase [Cyanobacteria bacterium]|nr:MBL fold metallo-hydrolase [Cyanobacteriota bacterium]
MKFILTVSALILSQAFWANPNAANSGGNATTRRINQALISATDLRSVPALSSSLVAQHSKPTEDSARHKARSSRMDNYSRYYLNSVEAPGNDKVKITFLGTTSLLIDDGETQLLIDGFISRLSLGKAALSKVRTDVSAVDAALSRTKVDRLKAILVSHSHYDHVFDVAYVAQKTGAKLLGSVSTLNVGRGGGLADQQMALFEPGKKVPFGKFSVTVIPSKHSPALKGINNDIGDVIEAPLKQPARVKAYREGGSFDFLIEHEKHSILVKPSANFIDGSLDNFRADVLFLSVGQLGRQNREFQNNYYDQTVGKVKPHLVIPVHWDNFFQPLSDHLEPLTLGDKVPKAFDFLIGRLSHDGIKFGILQGYASITLPDKAESSDTSE